MKFIKDLKDGDRVFDIYLCKHKQSAVTKNGKPYDSVILQDKTGIIDAKIWEPNNAGIDDFDALDYVEVYGEVNHCVIGSGVTIGKGAIIKDSIIMNGTVIGEGAVINKAVIAENVVIGNHVELGVGDEAPNDMAPHIYSFGLVTIGGGSTIPDNVKVGKNTAIFGPTTAEEYPDGLLKSGSSLIKVGDLA